MSWQLAEAKNKLSEVMNQALEQGPQRIRRRGDTVVMLSESDYDQLTGESPSLKDFLLTGPDMTDVEITRDESPMREVAW